MCWTTKAPALRVDKTSTLPAHLADSVVVVAVAELRAGKRRDGLWVKAC